MAEEKMIGMSKEQFQQFLEAIQNPRMNALQQKEYEEQAKKEKRRAILAVELGNAEAEGRWRRQNSCTHSRDPKTGHAVPRGQGDWTTGGQVHTKREADGSFYDVIGLNCVRCATRWIFKATPQELEYAMNSEHGLLGFVPPPISRCINADEFAPPPVPNKQKLDHAYQAGA